MKNFLISVFTIAMMVSCTNELPIETSSQIDFPNSPAFNVRSIDQRAGTKLFNNLQKAFAEDKI